MNIRVQVMSAQAQAQIKALQAQVAALQKQAAATGAASAGIGGGAAGLAGLRKWGNQLQWSGRMLQYNFTVPLLLAGGAATKFALDQEKAMTRVAKVYGSEIDAQQYWMRQGLSANEAMRKSNEVFAAELEALEKSFIAMSNRYGVAASEVMEVAGAWAAAGASGENLARSVDTTMRAMILGELEAAEATDALIAIQAQYNLNSKQLVNTLAQLNAIENETGITTGGLVQGFTRAAAVAREAGVDTRHLGAMLAALVPATGSASQAGNALKTIISRVLAPTKEAAQVINEMGFEVQSVGWQSATASERIQMLAEQWDTMNGAAKATAGAVIASRWQITKFEQLMEELSRTHGFYQKALDATSSRSQVFSTMNRELNAVLESSPARLEQVWRAIQNGMATAVAPMIPYLLWLAQSVADAVHAFQGLPPELQKLILLSLLFTAALGPIIRYLGALGTALWAVTRGFALVGGVIGSALGAIGAAAGWMISGLAGMFAGLIGTIVGGLSALPAALVFLGRMAMVVARDVGLIGRALVLAWVVARGAVAGIITSLYVLRNALLGVHVYGVVVSTGAWATITGIWSGGIAALSVLLRTGVATLLGALLTWSFNSIGIVATFWSVWRAIQGTMLTWWITTTAVASTGVSGIYANLYAGIAGMTTAFGAWLSGLWTAVYTRLIGLQIVFTGLVPRIWAAMHAAQAVISTAFWSRFIQLWLAGVAALMKINWALVVNSLRWAVLLYRGPLLLITAGLGLILGVFYSFRDEIEDLWHGLLSWINNNTGGAIQAVINAWNMLPQGVANAINAVVQIVSAAAQQVYEWMSYLNPFARHSPSLVENVTNGMKVIGDEFERGAKRSSAALGGVYPAIRAFGAAIKGLEVRAQAFEMAQDRMDLKKFAPGSLDEWDALAGHLRRLTPLLASLEAKVAAQEAVVARWQSKVDAVNERLEKQQAILDRLQGRVDKWQDKLSEAESRLDDFANAPLKGMAKMEEAIFANQMAQNKLRLELMKLEETYGTYDTIKSKIDAINGAQEMLRGTQQSLYDQGAGSDVLSAYDEQLKKLDKQETQYEKQIDKLADVKASLAALQLEAEKLDLTKSMKFDELQRQIDIAAGKMQEEMTFDEIIKGIKNAQGDITLYSGKLEEANKKVRAQQGIVDGITKRRDGLQNRLDKEQDALDRVKDRYDKINQAVQDINSAMDTSIQSAQKLDQALKAKKDVKEAKKKGGAAGSEEYISPGLQNFRDAMKYGGDFPEVGGSGALIRKNWQSEVGGINDITQQLADETARMFGGLNPFGPVKRRWEQFVGWFMPKWDAFKSWADSKFGDLWAALTGPKATAMFDKVKDTLGPFGETIVNIFKTIKSAIGRVWRLLGPELMDTFGILWEGVKKVWNRLGPIFASFGDLIKPLGEALQNLWTIAKPILGWIILRFLAIAKVVWSTINGALGPAIDLIIDVAASLIKIVRGIVKILIGLFTDPWLVLEGVWDIIDGLFGGIIRLVWNFVKVVWGAIKGFVKGVIGFFMWLYNEVFGHSIIPDLIDGIIDTFKLLTSLASWLWNRVLRPIWNLFKAAFNLIIGAIKLWWSGVKAAWSALAGAGQWIWNNVLQPVWSWFKGVWKDYIKPALKAWWSGVKTAWKALTKLGKWVWKEVLKPVWNWIKDLWKDYVGPGLKQWWENVKTVWSKLKKLGKWVWENVLRPVWNWVKDLWKNYVKPGLRQWWENIKTVWDKLKQLGSWIWKNVLKPVWDKAKELWPKVKDNLQKWWENIKTVWNGLKKLGKWVWDNVMKPVFDTIKDAWTKVKDWLRDNKDMLLDPAKSMVNAVISAVNLLIRGLNKVSDILPGIDFEIKLIPKLAAGGAMQSRRVGGGFKTNGARAIVGEGKANYPEFVIPTDPTHRRRARALLGQAASRLGGGPGGMGNEVHGFAAGGVPMYDLGGIIGDIAKGAWKNLKELPRNAVRAAYGPGRRLAENKINGIKWNIPRGIGMWGLNKVSNWVTAANSELREEMRDAGRKYGAPKGGNVSVGSPLNPGGHTIWNGGTFSQLFVAHMKKAEQLAGSRVSVMQGGFRPTTSYSGTSHRGDAVDFQVSNALIRAFRRVGIAAGDRTGLGDWEPHVHAVPGPDAGYAAGSAVWQWQDYMARGGMNQSLTSPWGLKNGGIIRRTAGGVLARIGEGRHDEAVTPLPSNWKTEGIAGKKETHLHFYGDLEFPNITDGDDAQAFITNLEIMAKD